MTVERTAKNRSIRAARHQRRLEKQNTKCLKVGRGTARRIRRERAKEVANSMGVERSNFSIFWQLGGDAKAAERVVEERKRRDRQKEIYAALRGAA